MPQAQAQSAQVSRQDVVSLFSRRHERLRLLRQQIAGLEATSSVTLPHASTPRIPLGPATRLDFWLSGGLATGALHEIVAANPGDHPAAAGFALALAARLHAARNKAPVVWIGEDFASLEQGLLYGPGLARHGIDPAHLILVRAANAKDALWAIEEALKCRALAAVIGEIFTAKAYDLTASRRLVLAAQKRGTPGLLFFAGLTGADHLSSGANTRFEIKAHPSLRQASAAGQMPLPGAAAWSVRIAKARAAGFAIDREKFHSVFWSPEEVCFRDALSLPLAAVAGDGSDHPASETQSALA